MRDVLPGLPDTSTKAQPTSLNTAKDRRRTSLLKFYIHDSAAYFRIELLGELTGIDIDELAGCWRTAKSSVTARKLALDVRQLKGIDEAGREWLASMVQEGAYYITGKTRSGAYIVDPNWRPGNSPSEQRPSSSRFSRALQRLASSVRQSVAEVDTGSQTSTVNADSVRATGL